MIDEIDNDEMAGAPIRDQPLEDAALIPFAQINNLSRGFGGLTGLMRSLLVAINISPPTLRNNKSNYIMSWPTWINLWKSDGEPTELTLFEPCEEPPQKLPPPKTVPIEDHLFGSTNLTGEHHLLIKRLAPHTAATFRTWTQGYTTKDNRIHPEPQWQNDLSYVQLNQYRPFRDANPIHQRPEKPAVPRLWYRFTPDKDSRRHYESMRHDVPGHPSKPRKPEPSSFRVKASSPAPCPPAVAKLLEEERQWEESQENQAPPHPRQPRAPTHKPHILAHQPDTPHQTLPPPEHIPKFVPYGTPPTHATPASRLPTKRPAPNNTPPTHTLQPTQFQHVPSPNSNTANTFHEQRPPPPMTAPPSSTPTNQPPLPAPLTVPNCPPLATPLTPDQEMRRLLLPAALWDESEDTLLRIMKNISTYLSETHFRKHPNTVITVTRDVAGPRFSIRERRALTGEDGVRSDLSQTPTPRREHRRKHRRHHKGHRDRRSPRIILTDSDVSEENHRRKTTAAHAHRTQRRSRSPPSEPQDRPRRSRRHASSDDTPSIPLSPSKPPTHSVKQPPEQMAPSEHSRTPPAKQPRSPPSEHSRTPPAKQPRSPPSEHLRTSPSKRPHGPPSEHSETTPSEPPPQSSSPPSHSPARTLTPPRSRSLSPLGDAQEPMQDLSKELRDLSLTPSPERARAKAPRGPHREPHSRERSRSLKGVRRPGAPRALRPRTPSKPAPQRRPRSPAQLRDSPDPESMRRQRPAPDRMPPAPSPLVTEPRLPRLLPRKNDPNTHRTFPIRIPSPAQNRTPLPLNDDLDLDVEEAVRSRSPRP